ncbi:unnamed protein product [Meganyctiphanes norvegica]|uniref:Uncharacterized protein n=1 Tax=Meganyctiphanes norvegica TaxID=48144 RepID=A0AAV2S9G4_MEGNR
MDGHPSLLQKYLLDLLDSNTTPENALHLLSFSCFSLEAYRKEDDEPAVIFLAYMRFIMTRRTDACLDGIWEEIFRKTLRYCRGSENKISHMRRTYVPFIYTRFIPEEETSLGTWIEEALSTHTKCPNPYIRLELFGLISVLWEAMNINLIRISRTFIHTVGEIQPHHLYPSGNVDDVLFDLTDFDYIINHFFLFGDLKELISSYLLQQINNKLFVNSIETRFISHCIQLIGVFAVMAETIPDPKEQFFRIRNCCLVFRKAVGSLVNCGSLLPGLSYWKQFVYIVSLPPFRNYVIETVRNLTEAIMNNKLNDLQKTRHLIVARNTIAEDLGVCTKTLDLPKLLLSREEHGPNLVRQHSLLLRNVDPHDTFNSDSDIHVDFENHSDPYWFELQTFNDTGFNFRVNFRE